MDDSWGANRFGGDCAICLADDYIRRMIYDEKLIIPKTKDPIQAKEKVRFCFSFSD